MSDERAIDEQGSLKDERTREEVYCCAVSPGEVDYACTLPPGHAGDHIAESLPGNICAQWPGAAAPSEPGRMVPRMHPAEQLSPDPLALDPEDGTLCGGCGAPRNQIHSPMCPIRAGASVGRNAARAPRIPVDGALRALRDELHSSGRTQAPDVLAAFEVLALAIEQAQTFTGTIEPEASITLVPARMTTLDTLQAIAALVSPLASDSPRVHLGTMRRGGRDLLATLPATILTTSPSSRVDCVIEAALVEVDGVEFQAQFTRDRSSS